MSMDPVTPSRFNPVLGTAMVGAVATVCAVGTMTSRLTRYHWINGSLHWYCRLIIHLSEGTQASLRDLAGTMTRADVQRARVGLLNLAEENHAYFLKCFDPRKFREAALIGLRNGNCPKMVAQQWVKEIVAEVLDFLDKVQFVRMKNHPQEWSQVEKLKQDLVNYWGRNGFDVSRWEGREYNYILRSSLKTFGRCLAYPVIAAAVVAVSFYLAVVTGAGM